MNPGDSITYAITYKNAGNIDVNNAVITDALDAGVTYVSDTGGGTYDLGTHDITWSLGMVAQGASGSFQLTVTVNAGTQGTTLNNSLTADSDETFPGTFNEYTNVCATCDCVIVHVYPDDNALLCCPPELGYTVEVENVCDTTQCVDAWTNITLPNGNTYPSWGVLLGYRNVCLDAYETKSRHYTLDIPDYAPHGTYTYNAFAGLYPIVSQEDHFNFTVPLD